jgi:hypothetical protein
VRGSTLQTCEQIESCALVKLFRKKNERVVFIEFTFRHTGDCIQHQRISTLALQLVDIVIVEAFAAYAASGVGDIKKLRDVKPPTWRLRVGRFRVLYRREGSGLLVTAVVDRKDAYR